MQFLQIKVPKNNEYTYEQSLALFLSLHEKGDAGLFGLFAKKPTVTYSFNILSQNQQIMFLIGTQDENITILNNHILAHFPNAEIKQLDKFPIESVSEVKEISLSKTYYLPVKTMREFTDVDPLTSVLSTISRSPDPKAVFWLQMIIKPNASGWQQSALRYIDSMHVPEKQITQVQQNQIQLIHEKIKYDAFDCSIRLVADSKANLEQVSSAFNIYALPSGNSLKVQNAGMFGRTALIKSILEHKIASKKLLLNTIELATLWHLPTAQVNIPNIVWGKKLTIEPPENLPVAHEGMTDEEKKNLTFLGKTTFKNRDAIFGSYDVDRTRHVYIVGKTGTGKSTLIANMAIDDIRKGKGVGIIDPHGDTVATLLEYIPKSRINDVCYFNPADLEYAYPLNMLEISNPEQKELMVSGIISIFYKIYSYSWGPRLEHILRNVLFTLINVDNSTLADVLKILVDAGYRKRIVSGIKDPHLLQFWNEEFEPMSQQQRQEAISPIANKVGQFVSSPLIRKIIAWPKSKVNIEELMNSGKIILCDLSQGKIGEDNAALLGAMIITQMQIAAMNRTFLPENERVPFYLYVDEFQNFATSSFVKILSEARKYKLALTLANQYIDQIPREILNAILGNVGSIMVFNLGANDAQALGNEFGSDLTQDDLTSLDKFQMIIRLCINMVTSKAFSGYSLALPKNVSAQREKIIEASRQRYGVKVEK